MSAPKGNKYALGLTTNGRPPVFESAEELEIKCAEYFENCETNKEKATITGLALFLGFESRQSIHDYKDKEVFSYVIKRAMLAVENSYETSGSAFDIFALKNMGWKDQQEVRNTNMNIDATPLPPTEIKRISKELDDEC